MTITPISKPTPSIVMVDPDTATRWLDRNTINRHANPTIVRKYADDMTHGRWAFAGDPIRFSNDRLLDGQHRLLAVVRAQVTLPFVVVRGLDPDVQHYMDKGRKRSLADQLALDGVKNTTIVASAVRLAYLWDMGSLGKSGGGSSVSDAALNEFLTQHPELHPASDVAAQVYRRGLDLQPSVVAVAFWGLTQQGADPQAAIQFFGDLADLRTEGDGDPRKALLRRLQTARKNRERLPQSDALSMVIRTWNAHIAGKDMHRIPALSRNGVVQIPRVRAA